MCKSDFFACIERINNLSLDKFSIFAEVYCVGQNTIGLYLDDCIDIDGFACGVLSRLWTEIGSNFCGDLSIFCQRASILLIIGRNGNSIVFFDFHSEGILC